MHVAVYGVEEELLAVDALPAKEHLAFRIKVVHFTGNLLETGQAVAVCIEVIGISVNCLEFALTVGTVLISIFYAAGSFDKSGCVRVSGGESSRGVARRYGCRRALHLRSDMIIQSVVELVGDLVDDVSAAVLDTCVDRAHISLAGDADVACFHSECEHAVIACTVDIAGILEVVDRSLHPAAAKR